MYLENYRNDIAISYAAADNIPFPNATQGWVDHLLEHLGWYLGQKLGPAFQLWSPQTSANHHPRTEESLAQLQDAATIIVLLSKAYLRTPCYQVELAAILSHLSSTTNRLFVVEHTQLTRPEPLQTMRGYRLWTADTLQRPRTFGLPHFQSERDKIDYYNQLEDLAHDLSGVLETIREQAASQSALSPPTPDPRPQVLLAAVTNDLYMRREEVKRYLEYNGIGVLPAQPYPVQTATLAWQTAFIADLAQAVAFVQLLSDAPAQLDNGMSLPQWQWATMQSIRPSLPLLQWRPLEVNIDTVQDPILAALLTGTEVRVTDIERFKSEIVRQVHILTAPTDPMTKPSNCLAIFINACLDDAILAERLSEQVFASYEWFCSLPLTLEMPPPDPAAARADLEAQLSDCDALLLLYGRSPTGWVRQQLLQIVKIIASRKPRPFVAMCEVEPLPKPNLLVKIPPFIQVLECGTLSEAGILHRFLQAMEDAT